MTRIVLFLTAVPLAAVLALLLDTLLDRRLAALVTPTRPSPPDRARRTHALWIALVLLASLAAAPAAAGIPETSETRQGVCASDECSLLVDAALVDRLWRPAESCGAVVVMQSRIPVDLVEAGDAPTADDRREPDDDTGPRTAAP